MKSIISVIDIKYKSPPENLINYISFFFLLLQNWILRTHKHQVVAELGYNQTALTAFELVQQLDLISYVAFNVMCVPTLTLHREIRLNVYFSLCGLALT